MTTHGTNGRLGREHPDSYGNLGALMNRLRVYGLETVLQRHRLIVINTTLPDSFKGAALPAEIVFCKERRDDAERLWYFDSWDAPVAEADRVIDAAVVLAARLGAK